MMPRRCTKLEELAEAVRTRHEQGETYAEIATSCGLEKKQLRKLMERWCPSILCSIQWRGGCTRCGA